MKKYSQRFIVLMIISVLLVVLAVATFRAHSPSLSAIFTASAFIAWYAGVMAPDNEKYR